MKFGSVSNPQEIEFLLPLDHVDTAGTLNGYSTTSDLKIYVGCSNWSKTNLKGFYPRGTKEELPYYAQHFNAIELNATFYRIFPPEIFSAWHDKTPAGFKFFPKIYQEVSHWKRLKIVDHVVDDYLYSALYLREKLGTIFLQMNANFGPKDFNHVQKFVQSWPREVALALEFRHPDWHRDTIHSQRLYHLLESHGMANIIVDTPGRRDLLHMRMTNGTAFIRFVAANYQCDYIRLDQWVERLYQWKRHGLKEVNFFIHQDIEKSTPFLATYFTKKLNLSLGTSLIIPEKENFKHD